MAAQRWDALLRGINVGGRNKIAMADLRDSFDSAGYDSVSTYIQSGNVLFGSDSGRTSLETDIEAMLERRFGLRLVVVVRSHDDLRRVVDAAPAGFGAKTDDHHYDIIFLKAPLTSDRAVDVLRPREGVDQVWSGEGVVYFSRLSARRTESRLSRVASTSEYSLMTIRNWNTTTTVLARLDASDAD
jgi:uncharacterized protein (DUF1697 family)